MPNNINMKMKNMGILCFLLIIPVIIIWAYDSYDYGKILMFSQDSRIIEHQTYDDLFDTYTVETTMDEGFWFGLMPAEDKLSFKATLAVIPIAGVLITLGTILLFINKRLIKKNSMEV